MFGYQGKQLVLRDNAIWSVLIVLIWVRFGWGMPIYYTELRISDPVLYEAAAIDGQTEDDLPSGSRSRWDEAGDSSSSRWQLSPP